MTNRFIADVDATGKLNWAVGDVPETQPRNAMGYDGPLHPDAISTAEAQKLLGHSRWNALTAAQREAAASTFPSELDGHDLKKIFGPGSDSAAANRLAMKNPVGYAWMKNMAKTQGIIA